MVQQYIFRCSSIAGPYLLKTKVVTATQKGILVFESLGLWRQNMYVLPNQIIITFSSSSENEGVERSWLQFPFWITLQKIFSWSNLAQAANRRSYPSHSDTNAADEDLVVKEAFLSVANSINFYFEWLNYRKIVIKSRGSYPFWHL